MPRSRNLGGKLFVAPFRCVDEVVESRRHSTTNLRAVVGADRKRRYLEFLAIMMLDDAEIQIGRRVRAEIGREVGDANALPGGRRRERLSGQGRRKSRDIFSRREQMVRRARVEAEQAERADGVGRVARQSPHAPLIGVEMPPVAGALARGDEKLLNLFALWRQRERTLESVDRRHMAIGPSAELAFCDPGVDVARVYREPLVDRPIRLFASAHVCEQHGARAPNTHRVRSKRERSVHGGERFGMTRELRQRVALQGHRIERIGKQSFRALEILDRLLEFAEFHSRRRARQPSCPNARLQRHRAAQRDLRLGPTPQIPQRQPMDELRLGDVRSDFGELPGGRLGLGGVSPAGKQPRVIVQQTGLAGMLAQRLAQFVLRLAPF